MFICFLAAVGLCCSLRSFSLVVASGGYSLVVVRGCGGFLHLIYESWHFIIQHPAHSTPQPPPRLPLTTTILPSASVGLIFFKLDTNCKHTVFAFLCLVMSLNLISSGSSMLSYVAGFPSLMAE